MGQTFGEVLHYLCKFEVKIIRFTGLFCNLTIIVLGTFVAFCPPFDITIFFHCSSRVRWSGPDTVPQIPALPLLPFPVTLLVLIFLPLVSTRSVVSMVRPRWRGEEPV